MSLTRRPYAHVRSIDNAAGVCHEEPYGWHSTVHVQGHCWGHLFSWIQQKWETGPISTGMITDGMPVRLMARPKMRVCRTWFSRFLLLKPLHLLLPS